MLTNEQRAHDLTCAVISNQTLLNKSKLIFNKDCKSYVPTPMQYYEYFYEKFLDELNKNKLL